MGLGLVDELQETAGAVSLFLAQVNSPALLAGRLEQYLTLRRLIYRTADCEVEKGRLATAVADFFCHCFR